MIFKKYVIIKLSGVFAIWQYTVFIFIGVALLIMLSREQQAMLLRFAYEDPLTKGANYAKFCMNMEKRRSRQGYLVAMDITNFNNINIAF